MGSELIYRAASSNDVAEITRTVRAAYERYVAVIGRPPAPMSEDYSRVVAEDHVFVVEQEGQIVGVMVLKVEKDRTLLDNVAILPAYQGRGIGGKLLSLAEDEALGHGHTEIQLYTNESMTDNVAWYSRRGYVEFQRRFDRGFKRVYMKKMLSQGKD